MVLYELLLAWSGSTWRVEQRSRWSQRFYSIFYSTLTFLQAFLVDRPGVPDDDSGDKDQCGGSGMFIPDPTFFHPGSRIRTVSIPDPGSSSKNSSILTPQKKQKMFSKLLKNMIRVVHPGSGCWLSPIPDPGSRGQKAPNPGSGSVTLLRTIPASCMALINLLSYLLFQMDRQDHPGVTDDPSFVLCAC